MSQEISREALLIYLNNVRTLETLLAENEKILPRLENRKENIRTKPMEKPIEPAVPIEPSKPDFGSIFWYDMNINRISLIFVGVIGIIASIALFIRSAQIFGYSKHPELDTGIRFTPEEYIDWANDVRKVGMIALAIGLVCTALILIPKLIEYFNDLKEYRVKYRTYQTKQQEYPPLLEKYNREIAVYNQYTGEESRRVFGLKQQVTDIQENIRADMQTLQNDLQQAYSANIIPLQFRDIHGVYYLYDYLSTSNESLTSALMQANLEVIKQKLDKMIEMQGTMIIQQAQANQALFEQNQQILETARGIENNTAVAAQYAKISAVNSAVSLRLQEQQLAYQKADYWLHIND